jgi:hypothetical protein
MVVPELFGRIAVDPVRPFLLHPDAVTHGLDLLS